MRTSMIEKTKTIRAGFDPLHRNRNNPTRSKSDFVGESKSPKPTHTSTQKSGNNSNIDPKLTYRPTPGSNSGGSGKGNSGENFPNRKSDDQEICEPEFWDSIENLGESDGEENDTPTEAPKTSTPTGKLTAKAIPENDQTTKKMIPPIEFTDWEGDSLRIKSKELKKNVFAKGYSAGVVPPENLVDCPIQDTPGFHQRTDCGLITDESVDALRDKLVDLSTKAKEGRLKFKTDMPFYQSQKAIGYLDTKTGDCGFYHEDSGNANDFWIYMKYNDNQMLELIANADWVRSATPPDSNPDRN